jgi:hypothetical protein
VPAAPLHRAAAKPVDMCHCLSTCQRTLLRVLFWADAGVLALMGPLLRDVEGACKCVGHQTARVAAPGNSHHQLAWPSPTAAEGVVASTIVVREQGGGAPTAAGGAFLLLRCVPVGCHPRPAVPLVWVCCMRTGSLVAASSAQQRPHSGESPNRAMPRTPNPTSLATWAAETCQLLPRSDGSSCGAAGSSLLLCRGVMAGRWVPA